MNHITKHLSWIAIIVTLITPILSTTHQDYTYKDCSLFHQLKIYKNINIDANKIDSICCDMREVKAFLVKKKQVFSIEGH